MLRAIVQSSPRGVLMEKVGGEYRALTYQPLPFRSLGYDSLESFLRSIPDTVRLERSAEGIVVKAVADSSTAKLQKLIDKQKKPKARRKAAPSAFRRPTAMGRGGFSSRGRGGAMGARGRPASYGYGSYGGYQQKPYQQSPVNRGGYQQRYVTTKPHAHVLKSPQSRMLHDHATQAYNQRSMPSPLAQERVVTIGSSLPARAPQSTRSVTYDPTSFSTKISVAGAPASAPTPASPSQQSGGSGDTRPPKPSQPAQDMELGAIRKWKVKPTQLLRVAGFVYEKPSQVAGSTCARDKKPCMTQILWEKIEDGRPKGEGISLVYQAPTWNFKVHTDLQTLVRGTQLRVYGFYQYMQQQFLVEYYEKKSPPSAAAPATTATSASLPTQSLDNLEEEIRKLLTSNGKIFHEFSELFKSTYGRSLPGDALKRMEAMQSIKVDRVGNGIIIIYPNTKPGPSRTTAATTAGLASTSTTMSNANTMSLSAKSTPTGTGSSSLAHPPPLADLLDPNDTTLHHPVGEFNYKNKLCSYLQQKKLIRPGWTPEYRVENVQNRYRCHVKIRNEVFTTPLVPNSKLAQFAAAKMALGYYTHHVGSLPIPDLGKEKFASEPSLMDRTFGYPEIEVVTVKTTIETPAPPPESPRKQKIVRPEAKYIWDEISELDAQYIDLHVTAIYGPYDIYARWYDCRFDFDKMESDLEEFVAANKLQRLERPRENSYCLVKSGDQYLRGKVQQLRGAPGFTAEVLRLDDGFAETVEVSALYELPYEFYQPPFQAFMLSLNDVAAEDDAAALLEEIMELISDKDVVAQIIGKTSDSGRLVVELFDTSSDQDVAINVLLREKFSSMHAFKPALPYIGERTDVTVSDISKCGREVFVQIVGRGQAKLDEMAQKMHEQFSKPRQAKDFFSGDQLCKGKICCARYAADDNWYRAVITKIDGVKVTVRYLDYGNTDVVATSSLRDIALVSSWIAKLPAQAIQCVLHDLPPDFHMNKKAEEFFQGVTESGASLKVMVEAGSGHPASVQLFVDWNGEDLNVNDEIWFLTNDEAQARSTRVSEGALDASSSGLMPLAADAAGVVQATVDRLSPGSTPTNGVATSPAVVDRSADSELTEVLSNLSVSEGGAPSSPAVTNDIVREPPQFPVSTLTPPMATDVYTLAILPAGVQRDPSNFVMSVSAESWERYMELEQRMTAALSTTTSEVYNWRPGHTAAVHTDVGDGLVWVRARILSVKGNQASCFLLDYGSTCVVDLADVRPLAEEYCQLPGHAVRAALYGITPVAGSWSPEACALFTAITSKEDSSIMALFPKHLPDAADGEPSVITHLIVVPDDSKQEDIDVNKHLLQEGFAVKTEGGP